MSLLGHFLTFSIFASTPQPPTHLRQVNVAPRDQHNAEGKLLEMLRWVRGYIDLNKRLIYTHRMKIKKFKRYLSGNCIYPWDISTHEAAKPDRRSKPWLTNESLGNLSGKVKDFKFTAQYFNLTQGPLYKLKKYTAHAVKYHISKVSSANINIILC